MTSALGNAASTAFHSLSEIGADPMRTVVTDDRLVFSTRSFSRRHIAYIGGTPVSQVHPKRSIDCKKRRASNSGISTSLAPEARTNSVVHNPFIWHSGAATSRRCELK